MSDLRLRQVLAGAHFPADRWELIACAEHYGSDGTTLSELHDLPAGRYESIDHVVHRVRFPLGVDRGS